ncbi:hypothetical protein [Sphingosinicella terrae]|uniref:hypothetical protein n=1 Tax=Sphingosinicella terrae TaxID=2172047 RepID=UPI000E0D1656|nr:hypothetical protein [Sphingosinicella terrae]
MTRNTGLVILSWSWIVLLGAYLIWGAVNESGLYAWLAQQQVERFGGYYPKATVIFPWLILGGPAWWLVRRRAAESEAALAAQGPAAQAQRSARVARTMLLAGLVSLAVAAGAWMYSQRLPDGAEPAVAFDASTLGTGEVPAGPVRIRGSVDPDAGTVLTEQGLGTDDAIVYAGFRPDGTAKDAPHVLFVRRRAGSSADAATAQAFLPDQEGYLTENGLPPLAREDLESRGVRIADPYYVLGSQEMTGRETWYVVVGVAGFFGFVALLVGLIGSVQARGKRRRAEAIGG